MTTRGLKTCRSSGVTEPWRRPPPRRPRCRIPSPPCSVVPARALPLARPEVAAVYRSELLRWLVPAIPVEGPQITGVSHDSRADSRGDLFFALPGTTFDGRVFAR